MIHRYWTGANEPPVRDGWVWHDSDIPDSIATNDSQVRYQDIPRHRANVLRWWLLWEHGGVWLDHDADLRQDPYPGQAWISMWPTGPSICAISLPAGHALASDMLNHISQQPSSNRRSTDVSGDAVVARMIDLHPDVKRIVARPNWLTHRWDTSVARKRERRRFND